MAAFKELTLDGCRSTAENGNQSTIFPRDPNIVNTAALPAAHFEGLSNQAFTNVRCCYKIDHRTGSDTSLIITIATVREGCICKCEDKAAVTDVMPVCHMVLNKHPQCCASCSDAENLNA